MGTTATIDSTAVLRLLAASIFPLVLVLFPLVAHFRRIAFFCSNHHIRIIYSSFVHAVFLSPPFNASTANAPRTHHSIMLLSSPL